MLFQECVPWPTPPSLQSRLGLLLSFHSTLNISFVLVTILIIIKEGTFLCFCKLRALGANFAGAWVKGQILKLKDNWIDGKRFASLEVSVSRDDKTYIIETFQGLSWNKTLAWNSFQRSLSSISSKNIYIPQGNSSGSFLFSPKGEFVYIREQIVLSLSHKGREGEQLVPSV